MLTRAAFSLFAVTAPAVYLVVCALLACLLAYPLSFPTRDFLGFHTLTSRGATVILVAGLFLVRRRLKLTRADIGLPPRNNEFAAQFGTALAVGAIMLTLHFGLLAGIGARLLNPGAIDWIRLARLAAKGLAIGLAVAIVEETVFRGYLLAALGRRLTATTAILTSSFYFAGLHFVRSDQRFEPSQITWQSSFRFAADSFAHLGQIAPDSFLALFTAGVFLGCLRLAIPHGLAWCIGIHAGWVFVIKTLKPFTHIDYRSDWHGLVSRFDGVIGYLSAGWISVLILVLVWQRRHRFVETPTA